MKRLELEIGCVRKVEVKRSEGKWERTSAHDNWRLEVDDGERRRSSGDASAHELAAHVRRRGSGGPNAGEALAARST
jgi:hypothetical protein